MAVLPMLTEEIVRNSVSLNDFHRLQHHLGSSKGSVVYSWTSQVAGVGREEHRLVSGEAELRAQLCCEVCHKAFDFSLQRTFRWLFVGAETQPLPEEPGVEVFYETPESLLEIFEDELILSLPLIFKHQDCDVRFVAPVLQSEHEHPFSVLGSLVN